MCITKKYFGFIFFSLFILSCETVVDVELPKHEPMIVVNSIGNPDEPWELNLSLSKGILDEGKIEVLNKAKVEILGNGNPVSTFNHYNDGSYKSTGAKPKVNVNYKLKVTADGFGTVTSSCIIPEPVKIESVFVDTIRTKFENELVFTISFSDLPNVENFYSLSILKTEKGWGGETTTSKIVFSSNDLLIREKSRDFESEGRKFYGDEAFFDDTILDGKNYKLKVYVNFYERTYLNDIEIRLSSLNKEYYQYLETREAQIQTIDNPFAEPVIIYSNIKNGLGIFSGYSTSKYKLF